MADRYPHGFNFYQQPHWPIDTSQTVKEDDDLSVLDEKILDPTSPGALSASSDMRQGPFDHQATQAVSLHDQAWHEPAHGFTAQQSRPHPYLTMPTHDASNPFVRMDPTYAAAYTQPHGLPVSTGSGTSTPTPNNNYMSQDLHSSGAISFHGGAVAYNQVHHQPEPTSATPMSPQSSQGGWASATSSDITEPRARPVRSPSYRGNSPTSHVRQDGIRKKNARFEIPAERNLHNIDSLIMQTNDETEKKELKQQKRLLRNRQAALDSRQRKKQHTEKLEQEKKDFNTALTQLEEERDHLQQIFQHERDQWLHQHQQFDHYIRSLEFERDEAIRTKTLETAELRKKNNILQGHLRDLERQLHSTSLHHPAPALHSDFPSDFSSFDHLGINDNSNWDDDFSLINPPDLAMDPGEDRLHHPDLTRQSTPAPPQPKQDVPFSWNAFYMCLLFGAFIASTSNSNTTSTAIPALSDEYRAESANVLKAVLASSPDQSHTLIPQQSHSAPAPHQPPTTITGSELAGLTASPHQNTPLDRLHATLTHPTRQQTEEAAFSLSASAYAHLTNPDPFLSPEHGDAIDADFEPKPSRLQLAYANMREGRADVERAVEGGLGLSGRSLLWERVPQKVVRDFMRMVEKVEGKRTE